MEIADLMKSKLNFEELKTINCLYFLPFDKIISIFQKNKKYMSIYKQNYISLEKEYTQYYNLNTRKKLNNITPILNDSFSTFISKIKIDPKLSLEEQINNMFYIISYSKIMNKILRLNKILLFRYTIQENSFFNFYQLISLIMFMDYPKEIILHINNSSLISSDQFKSLVNEIIKKENIVSFSVYFNKNYFTLTRNFYVF